MFFKKVELFGQCTKTFNMFVFRIIRFLNFVTVIFMVIFWQSNTTKLSFLYNVLLEVITLNRQSMMFLLNLTVNNTNVKQSSTVVL